MRLYVLMLFCMVLTTTWADPEPKKYKAEVKDKDKDKQSNTTLTADEKKFLRDVEEKYGIKNDAPKEEKKNVSETKTKTPHAGHSGFPAVIAIEIVNDTDTKSGKGKRTIDANLGYGYKTNNGYTYSYFGKPAQEKGKFMIYPYSQEDIPPANTHSFRHYDHSGKHVKTHVEITPSQAFELVPVKEEKPAYHYEKPAIEFTTPAPQSYSSADHGSSFYSPHPSTLYTTYNGEQFTGLTGQFPTVMPDYLVDPSQLIKNPEYQNVGLTQDHLRTPGSHLEQKVVPVLVLRIPSSVLTNPTAELYANLPHNYPLSNYINHLNLQELVNQYFKQAGYKFAPQVMAYPSLQEHQSYGHESYSQESHGHGASSVSQHEPQHYAHPYVQPSYTQAHLSDGVQYSAVQPVMARYPSSYVRQHYVTMPKGYSLYKQPSLPQKHEYQYQYTAPQSAVSSQKFYMPSTHYQQETEHVSSQEIQHGHQATVDQGSSVHDTNAQVQYEAPAQVSAGYQPAVTPGAEYVTPGAVFATPDPEYRTPPAHAEAEYEHANTVAPEYGSPQEQYSQSVSAGYESAVTSAPSYGPEKETAVSQVSHEYSFQTQHIQQETHSAYPSQSVQSSQTSQSDLGGKHNYVYQQQEEQSDDHGLVLSENYPSKDHTIATVLPSHYKTGKKNSGMIQTVSYVTPMPHSKYQLPYKVMVPQTFLYNPSVEKEKVTYVNSRPMSSSYSQTVLHQDYNPEAEYTVGYRYVPPVSRQKPPSFPRNYHSHPKRMVKPENKPGPSQSMHSKNKNERNEKKRLS